jgi:hypothetical protein
LQGNNASAARNFYAGASVTVTGGPDSSAIAILLGTFTGVTIAPVTADGTKIAAPAGGTRLTVNTAGSDRSQVILRVGSSDSAVGGTQYGRWDQPWAATTAQVIGDHRTLSGDTAGILTCTIGGTTAGTTPAIPSVYGSIVTDGTVTWLYQKLPAPGDVFVAEVEYEIESVTTGVAIRTQAQIARTIPTEQFAVVTAATYDSSATLTQGPASVWTPRQGVITSLPVTMTSLGFPIRHVLVDIVLMFPNAGSATVRFDRVSFRRVSP